jgi:hypothetical protein
MAELMAQDYQFLSHRPLPYLVARIMRRKQIKETQIIDRESDHKLNYNKCSLKWV